LRRPHIEGYGWPSYGRRAKSTKGQQEILLALYFETYVLSDAVERYTFEQTARDTRCGMLAGCANGAQ
jgi:hypothetical protein